MQARQIRVILYAEGALHGATAPADELPIEEILTVKHDVGRVSGSAPAALTRDGIRRLDRRRKTGEAD
jgi:hypothetical protein